MMSRKEIQHTKEWLRNGLPEGWEYNEINGFLSVEGVRIAYLRPVSVRFYVWAGTPEENEACSARLEDMRKAFVAMKAVEQQREEGKAATMVRLVAARMTPGEVKAAKPKPEPKPFCDAWYDNLRTPPQKLQPDGAWKDCGPRFAGHGDDSLVSKPVGPPSKPERP